MHPPSLRATIGPGGEGAENTRKRGLGKAGRRGDFVTGQAAAGAVDFGYLEGFAAGDMTVVMEVLSLYRQQAESWAGSLDESDPGWRDLVHTIKGASRGVGAVTLGDECARAEAEGPGRLAAVRAALAKAVEEIAAYQARHGT